MSVLVLISYEPIVLNFVTQVHGRAECKDKMNWLELTVGKVGSHLDNSLGVVFGEVFASQFHGDAHNVLLTDLHQLSRLLNLLLRVHH